MTEITPNVLNKEEATLQALSPVLKSVWKWLEKNEAWIDTGPWIEQVDKKGERSIEWKIKNGSEVNSLALDLKMWLSQKRKDKKEEEQPKEGRLPAYQQVINKYKDSIEQSIHEKGESWQEDWVCQMEWREDGEIGGWFKGNQLIWGIEWVESEKRWVRVESMNNYRWRSEKEWGVRSMDHERQKKTSITKDRQRGKEIDAPSEWRKSFVGGLEEKSINWGDEELKKELWKFTWGNQAKSAHENSPWKMMTVKRPETEAKSKSKGKQVSVHDVWMQLMRDEQNGIKLIQDMSLTAEWNAAIPQWKGMVMGKWEKEFLKCRSFLAKNDQERASEWMNWPMNEGFEQYQVSWSQQAWIGREVENQYDEGKVKLAQSMGLVEGVVINEKGWWGATKEVLKGMGWTDKGCEWWARYAQGGEHEDAQWNELSSQEWAVLGAVIKAGLHQQQEPIIRGWCGLLKWNHEWKRHSELNWCLSGDGSENHIETQQRTAGSDVDKAYKWLMGVYEGGENMHQCLSHVLQNKRDENAQFVDVEALMQLKQEMSAIREKREALIVGLLEGMKDRTVGEWGIMVSALKDAVIGGERGVFQRMAKKPTYNQLKRWTDDWHRLLKSRGPSGEVYEWTSLVGGIVSEDGNRRARELTSGYDLYEEGRLMHHCVSSYAPKASRGECRIFATERAVKWDEQGKPVVWEKEGTLELNPEMKSIDNQTVKQWRQVQFRGLCNRGLTDPLAWSFVKDIENSYNLAEQKEHPVLKKKFKKEGLGEFAEETMGSIEESKPTSGLKIG